MKKFLDYLQLGVSIATIAGVCFAYQGFKETMELQRETYAIQLYNQYYDLYERNCQLLDTNITKIEKNWTDEYQAFAERVLFTSESIYNIRGGSFSWDKTITYMLIPHLSYYETNQSVGDAFSEDFRSFYNEIKLKYFTRD